MDNYPVTNQYIRHLEETNQINHTSAIFKQKAVDRLCKFAGIRETEILSLPEQKVIDFLNSLKTANIYNGFTSFFKKYFAAHGIVVKEMVGKKHIKRGFLSEMRNKRQDETIEREREKIYTNQKALDFLLSSIKLFRDRMIVEILMEYGFRRSELASICVGDVEEDPISGGVNITCRISKTRIRKVLGIKSSASIRRWLHKEHPLIDATTGIPPADAPFICSYGGPTSTLGKAMDGLGIYMIFNRARDRAIALAKKGGDNALAQIIHQLHPHSLRHYATTQEIIQGLPEAMIKVRRGWSKDSDMIAHYSHVDEDDANLGYAAKMGVDIKAMKKKYVETPKQCPRCLIMNRSSAKICDNCGSPLDLKTAANMAQKLEKGEQKLADAQNIVMTNPEVMKLLSDPKVLEALKRLQQSA